MDVSLPCILDLTASQVPRRSIDYHLESPADSKWGGMHSVLHTASIRAACLVVHRSSTGIAPYANTFSALRFHQPFWYSALRAREEKALL